MSVGFPAGEVACSDDDFKWVVNPPREWVP